MARSLIQVDLPNGGSIGWVVPWMDLDITPWQELLRPLAELVGPEGVWSARPLANAEDDRHALTGY